MKQYRITFAAALLALTLLLVSCASGGDATTEEKAFSETGAVRLTETADLMETLRQVEAGFQDNSASTLFDAESALLRAERSESGVRVSAHWDAWTAYFALYAENGQMLGAAVAPDGVTDWETEIVCEANQVSVAKMFRLDTESRPVLPAIVASVESGEEEIMLTLTVDGQALAVEWEDNASVTALRELVKQSPVTIQMAPYGGFEQVGGLGASIPRDDAQTTTDAGDIVLYQGNQIVIFYGSNSWAYTRLGHIKNMSREELRNLLGGNGVTAVFSLSAAHDAPKVYFTADISPEGLVKAYQALNWTPTGKVAVKLSTGEPPNSNYLRPELIENLVKSINGTIVECNTAYGGSRASSAMHKQVAEDHGFTAIADFDLMDEDGEKDIPVTGGVRLDRAIVGSHIDHYDNFLILSHFKGHAMAGLGGAIKNVAIGMSSASGKVLVHTAGERTTGSIWYSDQDAWLEALPEMVTAVRDYVGAENIVYINIMNRLSVDCDCDGNPAEPDMHDIGILASYDPVALDQACVDLVYAAPDGASLIARMERQHGIHALEHGEEIGLGSRIYNLVNLDG